MIRTIATSALFTSAPILYFSRPASASGLLLAVIISTLLPVSLGLLVRYTRRRSQSAATRHTVDMLAHGGATLDLILAEADRRAAQRENQKAR